MTPATATATATGTSAAATAADPGGTTSTYGVVGMSCGHCVAAVTEALTAVPGVTDVTIDLAAKRATVTSAGPLDVAVVRDAIEGAGYQLA
jgi:copper chaperone